MLQWFSAYLLGKYSAAKKFFYRANPAAVSLIEASPSELAKNPSPVIVTDGRETRMVVGPTDENVGTV